MGLALDALVVGFLLWSLVRGWRFGVLYQIGHLAMLVVVYFLARALAGTLETRVATTLNVSPWAASTLAFFAVLVAAGAGGGWLVRAITRDLIPDRSFLSVPNRALGALVGLTKGVLISYLALVAVIQLQRISRDTPVPWDGSRAARFVAERNVLDQTPLGRLAKLGWVFLEHDPTDLARDPALSVLVTHPKAVALLSPEIIAAARTHDFVRLLQNEALWAYLAEPAIGSALDAVAWRDAAPARPQAPAGEVPKP